MIITYTTERFAVIIRVGAVFNHFSSESSVPENHVYGTDWTEARFGRVEYVGSVGRRFPNGGARRR